MIDALYISASGLRSQQRQIDVISNNVANLQTPGFKRSRVNFAELAGATGDEQGAAPSVHGGGSRVLSTSAMLGPGELRATQQPLDFAIEGNGFFELEDATGTRVYTRAGQFRLDREGYVTAVNGMRLAQGIRVPPDASELVVSPAGEISIRLADDPEPMLLATFELARFPAEDALRPLGDNVFAATAESGEAVIGMPGESGVGSLHQGYLEMPNVDLIDEMSTLVLAQRAYQLNARVLQAADQLLETINNIRR